MSKFLLDELLDSDLAKIENAIVDPPSLLLLDRSH